MGLNYSLCAILPRAQSTRFLEHLSKVLDASSRRRIKNLVWSPVTQTSDTDSKGIAGLQLEETEHDNDYGFLLQIKLEQDMKAYLIDHRFTCFDRADSFGSMWTSVYASPEYLLVKMTAATSGMSRVLEHSGAIHKVWAQFAKASKAVTAYVDLESGSGILVFPKSGEGVLPASQPFAWFESGQFNLNDLVQFIRQENSV
jgi:hypothetical protein